MFSVSSLGRVRDAALLAALFGSIACAGFSLLACGSAKVARNSTPSQVTPRDDTELGPWAGLPRAPSAGRWRYQVHYAAEGVLSVAVQFAATSERSFVIEPDMAPFLQHVQFAAAGSGVKTPVWRALDAAAHFTLDCRTGCRLRYQVRLADAARALREVDTALAAGQAVFAPPSSWLVRPDRRAKGEFRLRVNTAPGTRFMTAFECVGEANCEHRAPAALLDKSSFAAFGALEERSVERGGSRVVLGFAKEGMPFDVEVAARWLDQAQTAVSAYYREQLPAPRVLVLMLRGEGGPTRGKTLSAGGAAILLRAGDEINAHTTGNDWVLTHELLHVNFPDVGRSHAWLTEGLASYVEPLARARTGLLAPEVMWRDLIEGLPQGQPEPLDQGLEHTPTWGRIYWGGALFCLVADVMIRERTDNRRSLDDALHAVAKTGANVEDYWTLQRLWDVGDAATGTTVLHELYERMALRSETTDLDALYRRLGVQRDGEIIRFDESAPLAAIRRALTAPSVSSPARPKN